MYSGADDDVASTYKGSTPANDDIPTTRAEADRIADLRRREEELARRERDLENGMHTSKSMVATTGPSSILSSITISKRKSTGQPTYHAETVTCSGAAGGKH